MRQHIVIALVVGASACGTTDKGEEVDAPVDGKADAFEGAIDHREILAGAVESARLTTAERRHLWTFTIDDDAHVELATRPAGAGQDEVDTVLYLYRQGRDGTWGRYLARNDDAGAETLWSRVERDVTAGTFRVLVKGYDDDARGRFTLAFVCTGPACEPPAPTCEEIESYLVYNYCTPDDVEDIADVELCLRETPEWGDVVDLADDCCLADPELVFCSAL
jgi:hypothetical protein